jgi:hypothetical protein
MPSKVFFGDRSRAFGLRFYRHPSEPHLPDADDTHARFSDSPAEKLFSGKRMFPIFFISRRPEGRLFFAGASIVIIYLAFSRMNPWILRILLVQGGEMKWHVTITATNCLFPAWKKPLNK